MSGKTNQNLCPHCGLPQPINKTEEKLGYGQMLKACVHCHQVYLDTRVKEISVFGVSKADKRVIRGYVLSTFLTGVVWTAVMIAEIIWGNRIHVFTVFGPFVLLYSAISFIKEIVTYRGRKKKLEEETVRSQERLQNPQYRQMLSAYGIQISENTEK